MGKRLDEALAEADEIERADAEADAAPETLVPGHVKVSRPNRARSRVLQVRLNPDEFEALEAIAERRGLPVSTVAREQLLRLVAQDEAAQRGETPIRAWGDLVSAMDRLRLLQPEIVMLQLGAALEHRADVG
ncbi:hypothetical protein [Mycolicibacter senuensis]|uniref:Ribbon-helix-helix protein CopG domain-containing protein n=1 Tax=Mycolicibacter senuensis TaxID=386913 RepID=A0A7I9XML1_9MYCO|nr:hypothetical protein [Mycolicibacter senuensis]MDQ2627851.1 hypothetical protein [Actinomycetota bacterium]GFG71169.1 hypothetical protein MSEN_28890 [Mycolicibacter senuensis]